MAKERIISPQASDTRDEMLSVSLRPARLSEYVGQAKLIEKLSITLAAVRQRHEPMEHVLLHGPPGLGKTTLAHIIAGEMSARLVVTSGPALSRPGDLVGTLTNLGDGDVLFIDEIHRLPAVVEEYIYPAMEDFKIDVTVDSGMHARTITMPLRPFTLIGATTRAGLITGPLRSRFGITHNLDFYGTEDLLKILGRSAEVMRIPRAAAGSHAREASLEMIARRSRGTPRIANRLLRRVRDFAQVRGDGQLDPDLTDIALRLEGVDALGLDELDRKYLGVIANVYQGGPVGLEAVAATLSEDAATLEDVVEPYLLQIGFLARTRRGRQLTHAAAEHLGLRLPPRLAEEEDQPELFSPPQG
ncbi:MAG: Holliday junction branch migration DNA helicase RuvB [Phycisphaeraceae bacterium]|nr:Holliday junction branch migration DNA helicase RuvB [Phycisphaeraceae bacterium]